MVPIGSELFDPKFECDSESKWMCTQKCCVLGAEILSKMEHVSERERKRETARESES